MTTARSNLEGLPDEAVSLLRALAAKYIWWQLPDEAMRRPGRVIAQVMTIGDYADVQTLAEAFGDEALRSVLLHAEAGQFDTRSWRYWHFRLGVTPPDGEVPPLPTRHLQ